MLIKMLNFAVSHLFNNKNNPQGRKLEKGIMPPASFPPCGLLRVSETTINRPGAFFIPTPEG
jgi:hypothetical protein